MLNAALCKDTHLTLTLLLSHATSAPCFLTISYTGPGPLHWQCSALEEPLWGWIYAGGAPSVIPIPFWWVFVGDTWRHHCLHW